MKTYQTYPPYPQKFNPGDIAIATTAIQFTDNTKHRIGERIKVTQENAAYFNVWHHIYNKA
jgi:hypothetical protein